MRRFLVVLAVVCFSSIAAQADSITLSPASQALPISTSAAINGVLSLTCPVGASCLEGLVLNVLSGPDAGQTGAITITFPQPAIPKFTFSYLNNGGTGTDIIQVTGTEFPGAIGPLLSNTVTVTWVGPTPSVPEPSSFLLLLTGIATLALLRRHRMA